MSNITETRFARMNCIFRDGEYLSVGHKDIVDNLLVQTLPTRYSKDLRPEEALGVYRDKLRIEPTEYSLVTNESMDDMFDAMGKRFKTPTRKMFHGCTWDNAMNIVDDGFKLPAEPEKKVMRWGEGTYFARQLAFSQIYGDTTLVVHLHVGSTKVGKSHEHPSLWGVDSDGAPIMTCTDGIPNIHCVASPHQAKVVGVMKWRACPGDISMSELDGLPRITPAIYEALRAAALVNDAARPRPSLGLGGGAGATAVLAGPFGGPASKKDPPPGLVVPVAPVAPVAPGLAAVFAARALADRAAYVAGLQAQAATAAAGAAAAVAVAAKAAVPLPPKRVEILDSVVSAHVKYKVGDTVELTGKHVGNMGGSKNGPIGNQRAFVKKAIINGRARLLVVEVNDSAVRQLVSDWNLNRPVRTFTSTVTGQVYTVSSDQVVVICAYAKQLYIQNGLPGTLPAAPAAQPAAAPAAAPVPPAAQSAAGGVGGAGGGASVRAQHVCPGCQKRAPWNGTQGQHCCRTCESSNGARHGPDCENSHRMTQLLGKRPADAEADEGGARKILRF